MPAEVAVHTSTSRALVVVGSSHMLRSWVHATLLVAHAAAAAWDGTYYDPDDLKVTIKRTGNAIVAHSNDW